MQDSKNLIDLSTIPAPEYTVDRKVVGDDDTREYEAVESQVETRESARARKLAILAALPSNGQFEDTRAIDSSPDRFAFGPEKEDYIRKFGLPLGGDRYALLRRGTDYYRTTIGDTFADLHVTNAELSRLMDEAKDSR